MGVSLTLTNIPEAVLEQLRRRARHHHRSLQGEILALIEEALEPRRVAARELYKWGKLSGLRTPDESTAMIRADRDEH